MQASAWRLEMKCSKKTKIEGKKTRSSFEVGDLCMNWEHTIDFEYHKLDLSC